MSAFRALTSTLTLRPAGHSISLRQGLHSSPLLNQVKGQIASKAPAKVRLEAGKSYSWCACGLSGKQPFCDGSHKKSTLGITPLRWQCEATKDYFLCCCKQTNARPLCDGTHKKL